MDITIELNCLHNMFGPIQKDIRTRLQRVVNKPSIKTWENAYSILVQPNLTLWQAVCKVEPFFPRTGRRTDLEGNVIREWERVPTQEVLLQALRYAAYLHEVPEYLRRPIPLTE